MTVRRSFLLHVHGPERAAVVENVRTRERVRVDRLDAVAAPLEAWLDADDGFDRHPGARNLSSGPENLSQPFRGPPLPPSP